VYGVDVNSSAVNVTIDNVRASGYASRFQGITTSQNKVPDEVLGQCDVIISEILGTWVNSEDASKYISKYAKSALRRQTNGKVYIVPKRVVQTLSTHRFEGTAPSVHHAVDQAVMSAWKEHSYSVTGESGLGVLLHATPSTILWSNPVYEERYDESRITVGFQNVDADGVDTTTVQRLAHTKSVSIPLVKPDNAHEALHLCLFEWEAFLWEDSPGVNAVVLKKRFEGYRELDSSGDHVSSPARNNAWGVVAIPAVWSETVIFKVVGLGVEISIQGSTTDSVNGPPMMDFEDPSIGSTSGRGRPRGEMDKDEEKQDEIESRRGTNPLISARYSADSAMARDFAAQSIGMARAMGTHPQTFIVWEDITSGAVAIALREALNTYPEGLAAEVICVGRNVITQRAAIDA
jgi:hypothetical protein